MLKNKIRLTLPAIAILSLGLLVGCESTHENKNSDARAHQQGHQKVSKAKQRHHIIERFEHFKDQDGTVHISDVPQKARRVFHIIDTNNDDRLSKQEMEHFENQAPR
ncbi:MAG: EF-hand domain-containing protein [Mariprofundaceae bacterium]